VKILTCRRLVERATDFSEGKLSAVQRLGFRLHLKICANCRRYLTQLDVTQKMLGSLRQGSVGEDTKQALLDAFRKR
jgi:hypothetical protein